MSLIKCVECARDISGRASVCPLCGSPRRAIKTNIAKALVAIGVCLTVGAGATLLMSLLIPRFDVQNAMLADRILLGGAILWIVGWWNRD